MKSRRQKKQIIKKKMMNTNKKKNKQNEKEYALRFHSLLSAPDRAIEVAIAIAMVIAKTLIARSGVLCRGGLHG